MILILILISGCISQTKANQVSIKSGDFHIITYTLIASGEGDYSSSITVIHDDSRNVTCYTNWEMTHGGISCIPDKQIEDR